MASITRATGKIAAGVLRNPVLRRSHPLAPSSLLSPSSLLTQQERSFAADTAVDTYWNKKKADKELRTKRFHDQLAHKEKVKLRRVGKPKGTRKQQFQEWFIPKSKREMSYIKQARKLGLDWKLEVAVVLERLPIVLPDTPKWEEDYENLRTYLDQFGREYPEELVGKMEIEKLEDLTDEAILAKHLPRGYTPAPRETEADHNGDVHTLKRRLKTWCYLTVKEKVETPEGEKDMWRFPTLELKGEETILDTAKRAISEKVGSSLDIWYPSNCPMTVDIRAFDEDEREKNGNTFGVKTFFMVVQYDDGTITQDDIFVDDFAWLEKKEVIERIEEQEGEDKAKLYKYLLNDIWRHEVKD